MPIIRPYTDLGTNYAELSAILHQTGEPIFITKDGQVDAVLMSIEAWERLCARWELYDELQKGLMDIQAGRAMPAKEALDAIRKELPSEDL